MHKNKEKKLNKTEKEKKIDNPILNVVICLEPLKETASKVIGKKKKLKTKWNYKNKKTNWWS